jgi:hypothetical protein
MHQLGGFFIKHNTLVSYFGAVTCAISASVGIMKVVEKINMNPKLKAGLILVIYIIDYLI